MLYEVITGIFVTLLASVLQIAGINGRQRVIFPTNVVDPVAVKANSLVARIAVALAAEKIDGPAVEILQISFKYCRGEASYNFV